MAQTVKWGKLDRYEQERLLQLAEKATKRADHGFFDTYELLGRDFEVETYGRFITKVELTPTDVVFYGKNGGKFTKVTRKGHLKA